MTEKRWVQRFQNFEKAYNQLEAAVMAFDEIDDLGKEGLIKRFEYTFELAWKTLKDYLVDQGVEVKFPRDIIKAAFQAEIIQEGEFWLEMLDKRNLLAHTYNETNFRIALDEILNHFFPALTNLYLFLKDEQ